MRDFFFLPPAVKSVLLLYPTQCTIAVLFIPWLVTHCFFSQSYSHLIIVPLTKRFFFFFFFFFFC